MAGIILADLCDAEITDGTIVNSKRDGILVTAGASATVSGCRSSGNGRDGYHVAGKAHITNSVAENNGRDGIHVVPAGATSPVRNSFLRDVASGVSSAVITAILMGGHPR